MSKISLRRVLTRLTVLALSTTATAATAADIRTERDENCSDCEDDLDPTLAIDHEHLDARDAGMTLGRGLAQALGELRPILATQLASTWALSDDPVRRLAVANAMEWQFKLVGDDMVIDHLSHDEDPQIRIAAARAAWARRTTGGDPGVLTRLAIDPDPDVRAVAKSART